jgi:hypothetical protein
MLGRRKTAISARAVWKYGSSSNAEGREVLATWIYVVRSEPEALLYSQQIDHSVVYTC